MREGVAVEAHVAADETDVLGVNDRAQLAAIERIVQARAADALMEAGTSLADPARIDIRGSLTCGRDVRDRRRLRVRRRRSSSPTTSTIGAVLRAAET